MSQASKVTLPVHLQSDKLLGVMLERLVKALAPELIYLFGSRARKNQGPDSDYDFLVVVGNSSLPRYKRNQLAFKALWGVGASKDVIVLTKSEFESSLKVICSLSSTVKREGTLLHVA